MKSDQEKRELRLDILHGLARDKVDDVVASLEGAKRYLADANPSLRIAALSVLSRQFPWWDGLESECQRMAASDTDGTVRLRARLCLAAVFQRQNDPRAARQFAEIVKDDSVCNDIRLSCYVLLLDAMHQPLEKLPERFPDDVQWMIVEQALTGG